MSQHDIKHVLVSQPEPTSPRSPYYRIAEKFGVEFHFKPLFSIEPIGLRHLRDQKVDPLAFSSVVLTSRTIIDHFFTQLKDQRIELPATMKYYCSSEVIAGYLQKYIQVRKRRVYLPETNGSQEELLDLISKKKKDRYLIPTIEGQKDAIATYLEEQDFDVTRYVVSKLSYTPLEESFIKEFDLILFFSPNGVHSLFHSIPEYTQEDQVIGCLGDGTRVALEEAGLRVELIAPTAENPSITAAVENYLGK